MDLTVKIDSREQRPYSFNLPTVVAGLKVGDYSLVGYEDQIAIERKEINDLVGCLSSGRDRFERELKRGRDLDYFALVIEADLITLACGEYRSRMNPKSVIQSLLTFSVRYRLPIFFCPDRTYAARLTESLLVKYAREIANNEKPHWIDINELLENPENFGISPRELPTPEEERRAAKLTLQELFDLEPPLKNLYKEARTIQPKGPHFCANWIWFNKLKPKLLPLVGWDRPERDPILSTSAAYHTAYEGIYSELPGCLDCSCVRPEDFGFTRDMEVDSCGESPAEDL